MVGLFGTGSEGSFKRRARTVTIGVQAVVVDGNRRVLLVRHAYRDDWHFPGGGVERNEALASALVRELQEETGVVLEASPKPFGIYSHFDAFPGDHIVLFVAEQWLRPSVPPPNREIAEQGFFALDVLPEGTSPGSKRRLAEVFAGVERAQAW